MMFLLVYYTKKQDISIPFLSTISCYFPRTQALVLYGRCLPCFFLFS